MKREIFNSYVDEVTKLFCISKEELFTKNKKRNISEARQILYYLCFVRPMQVTYIEQYMRASGYDISHPSIIHGIGAVEDRISADRDYLTLIKKIQECVR
jgi:chromosomal replication initiation ATPase DnaA